MVSVWVLPVSLLHGVRHHVPLAYPERDYVREKYFNRSTWEEMEKKFYRSRGAIDYHIRKAVEGI